MMKGTQSPTINLSCGNIVICSVRILHTYTCSREYLNHTHDRFAAVLPPHAHQSLLQAVPGSHHRTGQQPHLVPQRNVVRGRRDNGLIPPGAGGMMYPGYPSADGLPIFSSPDYPAVFHQQPMGEPFAVNGGQGLLQHLPPQVRLIMVTVALRQSAARPAALQTK